jgi:dihydropteroate synthase
MLLAARQTVINFPRPALVMGILNLSVDSFSGDGLADIQSAIKRSELLIREGADIIDLGAESARTNREPISEQEEIDRLCGFIELWNRLENRPLLSINTWRPGVAAAALAIGGEILNDIGALPDDQNAKICAQTGAALLIMHSIGVPKVPHTHVRYEDVLASMESFFEEKIAMSIAAGVSRERLILDPGIDFAKQKDDNLAIYANLSRLHRFKRPILLPVSRKTVIGEVLGISNAAERDAGTVACIVEGLLQGAQIFRVHNVKAASQTVRTLQRLLN